MRGVTCLHFALALFLRISTHTPHARRDKKMVVAFEKFGVISTHTPHARRDYLVFYRLHINDAISTHTPHARRDRILAILPPDLIDFNSHASCEA